jgi:hypothetical protein
LQRQRRRQPRDSSADDRDPWRYRGARRPSERQRPGHGHCRTQRAGPLQELPARKSRVACPLMKLLDRDPQLRSRLVFARKTL